MTGREDGLHVDAHAALGAVFAADDGEPEGLVAGPLFKPDGQDAKLLTVAWRVTRKRAELGSHLRGCLGLIL